MGQKINQLHRRKCARKELNEIFSNPKTVVVVHYSCESFYDRNDGSSPRVTSIAVRNLASGQTKSFSIHQMAEKRRVQADQISTQFNDLEKRMLKDFFEYAKTHQRSQWLHWNMRDINYGFAALEHRYQVLGGMPIQIPEDNRHDLSRILISLFGVGYIGHPRLENLMEKNSITHRDFLNGQGEAAAFEMGEYVKLHQSTLRKVDILANIAERAENGSLKTNATWREIHGITFGAAVEWAKEHWIVSLVSTIGTLSAALYKLMPWFSGSSVAG
jgi:hypothetical protein